MRNFKRLMKRVNAKDGDDGTLENEIGEMFDNIGDEDVNGGGDGEKKEKDDEEVIDEELEDNKDSDDEEDEEEEEDSDEEGSDDDEEEEGEEDKESTKTVSAKKYNDLLSKVDTLMELVTGLQTKEEEKKEVVEPDVDVFESEDFTTLVEEMDWTDKEASTMKKFLIDFGKQIHNNTISKIMKETPSLISKTVTEQNVMEKTKAEFFSSHPALSKIKPYVANVASSIAKKNKNYTMKQVLKETADQIYEVMPALKEQTKKKDGKNKGAKDGNSKKPAFGKTSGARKGAKVKTGKSSVVDQIDEMLNID